MAEEETMELQDRVQAKCWDAPSGQEQAPFDLKKEVMRTKPDYCVYSPESLYAPDASNQHFLVFEGPDGSLMAIWTSHAVEGGGNHHIRFSRSDDQGVTWSGSTVIAGSVDVNVEKQASWAFPMVSKNGRVYVLYNRSTGVADWETDKRFADAELKQGWHYVTGLIEGIYSDDNGVTWSDPQTVAMPRGPLDNPDPSIPASWIVWQKPERLSEGKYYAGYTRWVSPAVRTPKHNASVFSEESVVEFMRFENLDDDPEIRDLEITYHAWGDRALRVPYYNNPTMSCAQEPSIVRLPDGRLMAVMRTMSGYLWHSLSNDHGMSWCNPRPLLYRDHGKPILHPLSCSPIYLLRTGVFVLFIHNNDGRIQGQPDPEFGDVVLNRTPVYSVVGRYDETSEQPLVFDSPNLFIDNRRAGDTIYSTLALYGSYTNSNGRDVFWYPDGKLFLLGKVLEFS